MAEENQKKDEKVEKTAESSIDAKTEKKVEESTESKSDAKNEKTEDTSAKASKSKKKVEESTESKSDAQKEGGEEKPTNTAIVAGDNESAASLLDSSASPVKRVKIKGAKNVPIGIVHVTSTFNNTVVTITDPKGNVIGWSTAGRSGFKGSRKSTAFAATMAAQDASRQAMNHGLQEVEVRVQGPGSGRESAVRAVQAAGINISAIRDVTPMPHNGCRPRKRRRV